jgi:hypothetical protein
VPLPAGPRAAALAMVLAYLALVLLVPVAALLAAALVPAMGMELTAATLTGRHFAHALSPGAHTGAAFGNSLLLSLGAALLLAAVALPVALAMRARAVRTASAAADLPYALPGACTGVAAILVVLSLPGGGAVYGTLGLILFAYLTRFQALALRPVAAAAARLDPALDEGGARHGRGAAAPHPGGPPAAAGAGAGGGRHPGGADGGERGHRLRAAVRAGDADARRAGVRAAGKRPVAAGRRGVLPVAAADGRADGVGVAGGAPAAAGHPALAALTGRLSSAAARTSAGW